MEIQINESEKWIVKVPEKVTGDGMFTMNYDRYTKDDSGAWILQGSEVVKIQFPTDRSSLFLSLTPYEQIIYVIKILNPDFKTAEDRLLELVSASEVSDTLKALLAKNINAEVDKMKVSNRTELNATTTRAKV